MDISGQVATFSFVAWIRRDWYIRYLSGSRILGSSRVITQRAWASQTACNEFDDFGSLWKSDNILTTLTVQEMELVQGV